LVEIVVFERGWVTLSANFRGHGASPIMTVGVRKLRVPGLSRDVVCVILRLTILTQCRPVTDT